ncbi:MAG: alpha/beta hydrolase [Dehalococcoidia bacterium]|nr:alpha/beta hydrolase [Dehalococcoidia bacterium]
MPRAMVNGFDMSYEVIGSGTPLLFIHGGFGGSVSTVAARPRQPWQTEVAKSHQFITYDRRFSGQSAYAEDAYTLPSFAKGARDLLRHLGVSKAIVMGDSAGGPIAMTYALTYPDTALALVLAQTSARPLADTHLDGPAGRRRCGRRGRRRCLTLLNRSSGTPRCPTCRGASSRTR